MEELTTSHGDEATSIEEQEATHVVTGSISFFSSGTKDEVLSAATKALYKTLEVSPDNLEVTIEEAQKRRLNTELAAEHTKWLVEYSFRGTKDDAEAFMDKAKAMQTEKLKDNLKEEFEEVGLTMNTDSLEVHEPVMEILSSASPGTSDSPESMDTEEDHIHQIVVIVVVSFLAGLLVLLGIGYGIWHVKQGRASHVSPPNRQHRLQDGPTPEDTVHTGHSTFPGFGCLKDSGDIGQRPGMYANPSPRSETESQYDSRGGAWGLFQCEAEKSACCQIARL